MKLGFVVAAVAAFLVSVAPPAQAELVGHYTFEEGAGTLIGDSSGRGNHGTLVNPRGDSWNTGHAGNGLYLPGLPGAEATYVNLGNPADFQLSAQFTFAAWVYSDNPASDAPILAKEGFTGGTSYWFGVFYNGFGTLCDANGWWDWDLDRRSLPVASWTRWNHLAATWDGSTLRQYLNGVLVDAVPFAGPLANVSEDLTIGVNSGVGSTAFTGRLDDVRIYNNALTSAQVAGLAETLVSGCVTLQGAPIANAKVLLKQDSLKQSTETGADGCYKFGTVVSGERVKIEIFGPAAQ